MLSSWVRANMPVSGHEPAGAQNSEPMSTGRASMHACMDVDVDSAVRALHMHASGPDSDKDNDDKLAGLAGPGGARAASLWDGRQRSAACRAGTRQAHVRRRQMPEGSRCSARRWRHVRRAYRYERMRDDHELIRGDDRAGVSLIELLRGARCMGRAWSRSMSSGCMLRASTTLCRRPACRPVLQ